MRLCVRTSSLMLAGLSMIGTTSVALADSLDSTAKKHVEIANPSAEPASTNLHVPGQDNAAKDIVFSGESMQAVGVGGSKLAAYFTVENRSGNPHLIRAVRSTSCSALYGYHSDQELSPATRALFTHMTLPPGQTLVFPQGGYHLVCDPAQGVSVKEGSTVSITFTFLGNEEKTVAFPVSAPKQYTAPE